MTKMIFSSSHFNCTFFLKQLKYIIIILYSNKNIDMYDQKSVAKLALMVLLNDYPQ